MKPVKTCLPPVEPILGFVSNSLNHFLEQYGQAERVAPHQLAPLIASVFESAISFYCVHETAAWDYVDTELANLFTWYYPKHPLAEGLMEQIIDPTYSWATTYLEGINADTWQKWIVVMGKSGIIALQCLGDYRILEWQQLVEEGKIKPPVRLAVDKSKPGPVSGGVVMRTRKPAPKMAVTRVQPKPKTTADLITGYRTIVQGKIIARATLPELEQALGIQFTKQDKARMMSFYGHSDGLNTISTVYGNLSVQTLWREDLIGDILINRARALVMNATEGESNA